MVKPGEPLWLPEDAQAVLEFLEERAMLCPGCGLPRDETMNRDTDGFWKARAVRCHACAARDREARRFTRDPHESGGLYFSVEKVMNG